MCWMGYLLQESVAEWVTCCKPSEWNCWIVATLQESCADWVTCCKNQLQIGWLVAKSWIVDFLQKPCTEMGDLLQKSKILGNPEIPEVIPARKSLIVKFRIPGLGQGSLITSLPFFTVWIYGDLIFFIPSMFYRFYRGCAGKRARILKYMLKCALCALVIRLLRGLHNSCVWIVEEGRHKRRIGGHTLARQKNLQKNYSTYASMYFMYLYIVYRMTVIHEKNLYQSKCYFLTVPAFNDRNNNWCCRLCNK